MASGRYIYLYKLNDDKYLGRVLDYLRDTVRHFNMTSASYRIIEREFNPSISPLVKKRFGPLEIYLVVTRDPKDNSLLPSSYAGYKRESSYNEIIVRYLTFRGFYGGDFPTNNSVNGSFWFFRTSLGSRLLNRSVLFPSTNFCHWCEMKNSVINIIREKYLSHFN